MKKGYKTQWFIAFYLLDDSILIHFTKYFAANIHFKLKLQTGKTSIFLVGKCLGSINNS